MKINKSSLKLRKKSKVHASIINSHTGRRKIDIRDWVKKIISRKNKIEDWPLNGQLVEGWVENKISSDMWTLKSRFKKPVNIFVLGPGGGAEVLFIKNLLLERKKRNNVDTIGITNQLSVDAKKKIRRDYSPNKKTISAKDLFEHMNHLKFVNKYDYIFSRNGPATHTKYREITLLKIASMLKPGGFARICSMTREEEVINNCLEYLKKTGNSDKVEFASDYRGFIIKRLK